MIVRISLLSIIAALIVASPARAQSTIYTTQASFLAAVNPGYYLENFNGLAQGVTVPSPLSFSQGPFNYTASAATSFFNVGPVGDVWLSTTTQADPIIFTFTSGNITAAGAFFFLTDTPGNVTTGTITATLNDGTFLTLTNPTSGSFIGFTSSMPLVSLTLTTPGGFDTYNTANDFIVGQAAVGIPEPASWTLIGFGVVGTFGAVWRYRRRQQLALEQSFSKSQGDTL